MRSVQVLRALAEMKEEGENPLSPEFRLKPVFERLPSGTDPGVYDFIR